MLTIGASKTAVRPKRLRLGVFSVILSLAAAYAVTAALLPAPAPILDQLILSGKIDTGLTPDIDWPNSKQAAVGAVGYGVLASSGSEAPLPMASIAKLVTALAVLEQKPLAVGEPGPTITLKQSDVDWRNYYRARGGSVVEVAVGEQITQYQAMQAMLIPSSNNMASTLADWAFGSQQAYLDYANEMLDRLGLRNTRVADAGGISTETVSTARDLILLGQEALKHPVVAEIAAQSEADVPVAGTIVTTNKVMGQSGISGIKTGHTNAAGGCFLFTATHRIGEEDVQIIGAILGAPNTDVSLGSAPFLINSALDGFTVASVDVGDPRVARVTVPWHEDAIAITPEKPLSKTVWKGSELDLQINVSAAATSGQVGAAKLGNETIPLIQQQDLPPPDYWWRLTHLVDLVEELL